MKQGEDRAGLFLDIGPEDPAPHTGAFLVTVGKRGYGTVYFIIRCRPVKRRDPQACRRFSLTVQRGFTLADCRGAPTFTLRWYPRTKAREI